MYTNDVWQEVLLVSNRYDHIGRRVKKTTPDKEITFFYDGWNLIEERVAYTNGNSTTFRYYWGKDLSGSLQGAGGVGGLLYLTVTTSNIEHQTPTSSTPNSSTQQLFIPCYDNNGNITRYLDANGTTVAQYTYDGWGNILDKSGPMCDVFRHRFSTKYYDIETGLYYYGYRFYCPWLMRWINRDPIEEEGGENLYAMCGNNAILKVDRLGMADSTVYVEGVGVGWAGAVLTLNGKTAVQLNGELYYLTLDVKGLEPLSKARIPPNGSTTAIFLYREGKPQKALRIDYHHLDAYPNKSGVWHINTKGGIAKVENSSHLNHAIKPSATSAGRVVTVFKQGGRICLIAGAAMSVIEIYRADKSVRETVRQVSGWGGAIAGGRIGAAVGSKMGMGIALAIGQTGPQIATPEELVTVPVFGAIGGVVGGVVGGAVGWMTGTTVSEKAYDWKFSPLQKEEWRVACE